MITARQANGTGPYMLKSREPDVKTVLDKNPNWWGIKAGRFEGNVDEVDLHADRVRRDARRGADLGRGRPRQRPAAAGRAAARADARHQGARGHREPHHLHRHGPGSATSCSTRTSRARTRSRTCACARRSTRRSTSRRSSRTTMRGLSQPTGAMMPAAGHDDARDREAAAVRPGDRRRSCSPRPAIRTASRSRSTARTTATSTTRRSARRSPRCGRRSASRSSVNAMPRANYFPKLEKTDTSLYMLGWGGGTTDAIFILQPVLSTLQRQGRRRLQLRALHATRSSTS